MDSLTPQQIIKVSYSGILSAFNIPTLNASVLQHSTSLREIRLTGADGHCYISASTILKECWNLEKLCIPFLHDGGLFIPLDDTLEHPWGCNKLTHFTLAISGCELPDEPGVQPHYRRATPITLTEDETQYFARLKELYRRIGGLKELRELDLFMPSFDEAGEVDVSCFDDPMLFPAMLNLEDARRGRPGFLQHLSGLKKLETLRGSVCVWSDETEVMMEWPEALWIDQNWPRLRYAGFFLDEELVSAPFAWLLNRRQGGVRDDVEGLYVVTDKYDDDAE